MTNEKQAALRLAGQILAQLLADHYSPGPKFDDPLSHATEGVLRELRGLANELQS